MVAAERVFQYLELGSSPGSAGSGRGGKDGGNSSSGSRGSSSKAPAVSSRATGWGGAAGRDLEAQRQPLLAPAAAGLHAEERESSSGSSVSWLHSGHVTFEDVWLRYEPWQTGGQSRGVDGRRSSSSSSGAANGGASHEVTGTAAGGSGGGGCSSSSSSSSPWVLRGVSLDIPPGKPAPALRVGGCSI